MRLFVSVHKSRSTLVSVKRRSDELDSNAKTEDAGTDIKAMLRDVKGN